jgi:hypothetical protein
MSKQRCPPKGPGQDVLEKFTEFPITLKAGHPQNMIPGLYPSA